jgi:hypothetical protein
MSRNRLAFQRTRRRQRIAGLAAALLLLGTVGSRAELRITGNRDSISIEARNAPLQQILETLRKSFQVEYQPVAGLERAITGTYSGSLHRVLTRLLVGHDYIIRSSAQGMEIVMVGNPLPADKKGAPAAQSATWKDGDGQLVALPDAGLWASPDAAATWRDGDGDLIAPPAQVAKFATADAPALWKDGDGNLIAPPPSP